MSWTPVADLDDRALARAAAARSLVRLVNGRVATLVKWPVHGGPNRTTARGRSVRLATAADTRFSVPCSAVAEVDLPQPSP